MHTVNKIEKRLPSQAIGPIGKSGKEVDMRDVDNGCVGGLILARLVDVSFLSLEPSAWLWHLRICKLAASSINYALYSVSCF